MTNIADCLNSILELIKKGKLLLASRYDWESDELLGFLEDAEAEIKEAKTMFGIKMNAGEKGNETI